MPDRILELPVIRESAKAYDEIEARILAALKRAIYFPLITQTNLPDLTLRNAKGSLFDAIASGQVTFIEGSFKGQFDAKISKELRALGAKYDRATLAYRLDPAEIPRATMEAINIASARFSAKIAGIDERLAEIDSAEIAESIDVAKIFATNLRELDARLERSLPKEITVGPQLTAEQSRRIAEEWETNLRLDIKGWADDEIIKLRGAMRKNVFAGNRYEAMVKTIERSYGVAEGKARFLARQETSLLTAKLKETRYAEAGVFEYRWRCVIGSPKHPVRPSHQVLNGKIFRFDSPPITTMPGQPVRRCNPGEDFGPCRCHAIPIVRFKA